MPKPRTDRTAALSLRFSPARIARWRTWARALGISMTELIERAVDHYTEEDQKAIELTIGRRTYIARPVE